MASIAEEIRNITNKLESLYKTPQVNEFYEKPEEVLRKAQDAFWQVVAQSYPEARSGDFPPDAEMAFDNACEQAVKVWLHYNVGK